MGHLQRATGISDCFHGLKHPPLEAHAEGPRTDSTTTSHDLHYRHVVSEAAGGPGQTYRAPQPR